MKWTGMAALVLVLAVTGLASATEPTPTTIRMPNLRGSQYSGANWWARYGEPVNQAAIDAAPAEAVVAPVGWAQNGHGYIYGPGSCDYTYPCTDWQWSDYHPHPWRCHPLHEGWRHGRCGGCGGCGSGHCGCGKHSDCGCAADPDCAAAPDCAAKWPSCETAPTCEAAPDCGCDVATECCVKKHFHWHWKHSCFWNKHCGCDTCTTAAPSCGCDAPAFEKSYPSPEQAPPKPITDDTQKAALVWPFSPVR